MYFICCCLYNNVYIDAAAMWPMLAVECVLGICRSSVAYVTFLSCYPVSFLAIDNSHRPVLVLRPLERTTFPLYITLTSVS